MKPAPSITNRFLTSCVCWNWFSTDVFGRAHARDADLVNAHAGDAIRTVHGRMFLAPAASSISAADSAMSGIIARLVVAPAHSDPQHRDAEDVDDVAIELHGVLAARQALAEPADSQCDVTESSSASLNASPKPGALQLKPDRSRPPWNP